MTILIHSHAGLASMGAQAALQLLQTFILHPFLWPVSLAETFDQLRIGHTLLMTMLFHLNQTSCEETEHSVHKVLALLIGSHLLLQIPGEEEVVDQSPLRISLHPVVQHRHLVDMPSLLPFLCQRDSMLNWGDKALQ